MLKGEGRYLSTAEHERYLDLHQKCMRELADFRGRLIELLKPYMLMELKRPWSLSRVTLHLRNFFWY